MANVSAFERAAKEILGEYGCLPMIAFGMTRNLSAFKLLIRARQVKAEEKVLNSQEYKDLVAELTERYSDCPAEIKERSAAYIQEKIKQDPEYIEFEEANEITKQLQNYELDVKHAIENNSDDPDYDVESDVRIDSYVDEKYLDLIEDSKQYRNIVVSISPHPCAHLLLDKDIRREIGVIRVKAKSGNKDAVYAAFIDGRTADSYNYLKADFLRVDVVKIIAETFAAIGLPVLTVDELLDSVKNDQNVWDLYWNGFTQGLNQCEREKSSQRCSIYKPRNVEELTAFVAGIRPGFKSMLDTFINRRRFSYGIPSLDRLLQTEAIPDSFLEFDEQILVILKAAGIPGPKAYATTKAINLLWRYTVMCILACGELTNVRCPVIRANGKKLNITERRTK